MSLPSICKRGHLRTPENVYASNNECKACHKILGDAARSSEAYKKNRRSKEYRERERLLSSFTHRRFSSCRGAAKRRGLEWGLDLSQYSSLSDGASCYYCSGPIGRHGVGLDRIDNSKGYIQGNVIPACGDCNCHRQHTWTVEEALVAIRAVLELRRKNVHS